jgi:uncharacterized damage-inducible protein DinB
LTIAILLHIIDPSSKKKVKMLGRHAIKMFDWTRYRTLRIINALPATFFSQTIPTLENQPFDTPAKILEHVAYAEQMYFNYILGTNKMTSQDFTFTIKPKTYILKKLDEIRTTSLQWLEHKKDVELDEIMFNRRTNMGWVFHHLPEHEAHHLGQICILALMAGHMVPNV